MDFDTAVAAWQTIRDGLIEDGLISADDINSDVERAQLDALMDIGSDEISEGEDE